MPPFNAPKRDLLKHKKGFPMSGWGHLFLFCKIMPLIMPLIFWAVKGLN